MLYAVVRECSCANLYETNLKKKKKNINIYIYILPCTL